MVKLAMGYLLIFLVMMQARLSSGQSSTTDLPSAATGGGPPAGNDPTARNNGFKGARKFPLCITSISLDYWIRVYCNNDVRQY